MWSGSARWEIRVSRWVRRWQGASSTGRDRARARQQDVVADAFERPSCVGLGVAPRVVHVQRRAMVDQPRPTVPFEHVHVLWRPVGVHHEPVEPHDLRGEHGVGRRSGGRAERQRAGQEVEAQVQPAAGMDEVLDLLVGLGIPEAAVDLHADDLRDGQPEQPGQLTADPLRREDARALTGAAELQDVHAVVVGLDERRQRTALAKGCDVTRRDDGPETRGRRAGRHGPQSVAERASTDVSSRHGRRPVAPRADGPEASPHTDPSSATARQSRPLEAP